TKMTKPINGYICFSRFYIKLLDKLYPDNILTQQEKLSIAGYFWSHILPLELQNEFYAYAEVEEKLKTGNFFDPEMSVNDSLKIIFDQHCHITVEQSTNSERMIETSGHAWMPDIIENKMPEYAWVPVMVESEYVWMLVSLVWEPVMLETFEYVL